jgi:DNA-binding SARP family transcriptional activator
MLRYLCQRTLIRCDAYVTLLPYSKQCDMIKETKTAPEPPIKLSLLGTARAFDGNWHDLPHDNSSLLGVYLAYQQDWVYRQDVINIFWPDDKKPRAQANLRQLLYRTRKLFWSHTLESTKTHVKLSVLTDVSLFKQAIKETDWSGAINLYENEFLLGFVSGIPEFENWLEWERKHLSETYYQAILNYSWQLHRPEDHQQAVTLLAACLRRDTLNEDALQHYLYHLYLAGERNRALRSFLGFKEELAKELGANPLASTEQLARLIRHNEPLDQTIFYNLLNETATQIYQNITVNWAHLKKSVYYP